MKTVSLFAICFATGCGLTTGLLTVMLTFPRLAPLCEALLQPASWIARDTDPTIILIAVPIQIAAYTLGLFAVALGVTRLRRGRLNEDISISRSEA